MYKHFSKLFALILSVSLFAATLLPVCAEEVIIKEPVAISSKEDLDNIRNDLDCDYYLTCDIEFTPEDFAEGGAFYNSGKGFVPIGDSKTPFLGTFDGRGFTISGLRIAVSGGVYSISITEAHLPPTPVVLSDGWTGDYIIPSKPNYTVSPTVGLFGVNCGQVKNLHVTDALVSANATNSYKTYVGLIVGHNMGNIINCAAEGAASNNGAGFVGGLAGHHSYGIISDCVSMVNLSSSGYMGGVVGSFATGTLKSSYTRSKGNEVDVSAVGLCSYDIEISAFYGADETVEGGNGTCITAENLAVKGSYTDFDFDKVWYMNSKLGSPWLKSFGYIAGDIDGNSVIDLNDVVSLAQYVAGWEVTVLTDALNVDASKNDEGAASIDLNDVVALAQYVAGWSVEIY